MLKLNITKLPKGDYLTAEEAVMDEKHEIHLRCESVNDVVSKNIISLDKALSAYEVTIEQYSEFMISQLS